MRPCVVNVATGRYVLGQQRLRAVLNNCCEMMTWADAMPPGSPAHHTVPYAFKAWAIKAAIDAGHDMVLWADACILPIRSLDPLWEQIERDGYWICRNGWTNYEWTAEAAYADLGITAETNRGISHVVATAFGLNLRSEIGMRFFEQYFRLSQTRAFVGPWCNKNHPDYRHMAVNGRCAPCGPADVRGHRHDQTAASVIAAALGMRLTDPPNVFAYTGGEKESTILVADGGYA